MNSNLPLIFSLSKYDPFEVSGPKHLATVNWSNPNHQRTIMACMVQGAYVAERDRTEKRKQLLAPDWWENFHYELVDQVTDVHDHSIYGVVLQFKQPEGSSNSICNPNDAPRFIVAFRGTMLDKGHAMRDAFLDLCVCIGGLNKTSRIGNAIKMVEKFVKDSEGSNVWLTGHSLGASTATIIGKHMAMEKEIHLKTFLFNPPFAAIPFDLIPIPLLDKSIKEGIHMAKSFFKGGLTYLLEDKCRKLQKKFAKLTSWTPYLFVHPADPVSMAYIQYFTQRSDLEAREAGEVARLAMRSSIREVVSNLVIKGSEMSHLLPSASLWVNRKHMDDFVMPHMIFPWWEQDVELDMSEYHCDVNPEDFDQIGIDENTSVDREQCLNHEDENVKGLMLQRLRDVV